MKKDISTGLFHYPIPVAFAGSLYSMRIWDTKKVTSSVAEEVPERILVPAHVSRVDRKADTVHLRDAIKEFIISQDLPSGMASQMPRLRRIPPGKHVHYFLLLRDMTALIKTAVHVYLCGSVVD